MTIAKPETLESAAQHLLDELKQTRCGCSPSDIASGHKIDCNWPAVQEAADWLHEQLEKNA